MRLIGYIRVSTSEQARKGVSLDAQVERIEAYAKYMGHELVEIVADRGVSAKDTNRPGFERVTKLLDADAADGLVVYSIDRFARSTLDFLMGVDRFAKAGKDFISLREQIDSSSPHGRFVMTVFAALAQMERELIASRTSEGLQKRKRDGLVYGNTPYGFRRRGKELVADRDEQEVLTYIYSMVDAGRPYSRIAKNLNRMEIPSKRGKQWGASNIIRLLKTRGKWRAR